MDNFKSILFNTSSVSDLSEFIPLLAWGLSAKKEKPYNILGVFFFFSALIKLGTLITAEMKINNMPAFHLLACLQIVMLFCFYSKLSTGRINKFGILLLIVMNAANAFFFQSIWSFNSVAWTINIMVLLGMSLQYLFLIYRNEDDYTPLEKRPDFVITAGWLIYAGGSLFTYLMGTEILSGKDGGFFYDAWIFECVANIIKNLVVAYGLWLTK